MQKIDIPAAVRVLKKDPQMAEVVAAHGTPSWTMRDDPFQSLVRSVIYQQLSGAAARTIYDRFRALFPSASRRFPKPEEVRALSVEEMQSAGISRTKAAYVHDLAEHFASGTIKTAELRAMENDEVVKRLTQIKGIGEWSAHMFLIFTLKRPDVLPTGDLGIRKGFQNTYGLADLPGKKEMERLAAPWREHASVASWYLWQAANTR